MDKRLFPILAVNFVGTLGFSIVMPFLVFLVLDLGGNAFVYGFLGAAYSVFQLIGAPILGRWSDRYGRRRILLLSQIGTLISWCIFLAALYLPKTEIWQIESEMVGAFTVTLSLLVLFGARILDGITGGNVSVANAYLSDVSDDENRSTNFGRMSVSSNLGFVAGPAIAGVLGASEGGVSNPILAAIFISTVATLLILFLLPETRPAQLSSDPDPACLRKMFGQEQKECYALSCPEVLSLQEVLRFPGVRRHLFIYFLVFLGFNFYYIAFPVDAVKRLDWELADTGMFFAVLGLLMAVVQGPALERASGGPKAGSSSSAV